MSDPRRRGDAGDAAFLAGMHTFHQAQSSDALAEGMDALNAFARRNARGSPGTVKGGVFERIVAAKFNALAARQGAAVRAKVTADHGRPTAPADIEVVRGEHVVGRAQMKNSDDPAWISKSQSDEKYRGMQKVVPSDKAEATRAHARQHAGDDADMKDTARRAHGELRGGGVRAGATTHDETVWATKHPSTYAAIRKGQAMAVEGAAASAVAAGNAALMAGLFAAVRHGTKVYAGEMDWKDAAGATARESAGAAVAATGRAAGATVLRNIARESGAARFAGSAGGGVVIASTVEIGVAIWGFAQGEITQQEFVERSAGAAVRNTVGLLCSKGAVALGGTGAVTVLAPMVGVMVAGYVFQSSFAILENAALAEEERIRIEMLCAESIVALVRERTEVQREVALAVGRVDESFAAALAAIDAALVADDDASVEGLARALEVFGTTLRFPTFEAFEAFLDDPDAELVL
jgi:hypothetical protein